MSARELLSRGVVLGVLAGGIVGCAGLQVRAELDHSSHPLAGWPCGDKSEEDGLTQANLLVEIEQGPFYVQAGVGRNLKGRGGGGFYGPATTGTVRAGVILYKGK